MLTNSWALVLIQVSYVGKRVQTEVHTLVLGHSWKKTSSFS